MSQGTPMLLGGDEFGRTQSGNNNAYCQDNEISWFDWALTESTEGRALISFVSRLLALRHRYPILRCAQFLHGKDEPAPGILDIAWFNEEGGPIPSEAWNNPHERTLILRRAARDVEGGATILTCLFNPTGEDRPFRLPPPSMPTRILVDSGAPEEPERDLEGDEVLVLSRSVVLAQSTYRGPPA
jgi:glycogen operon protein